MKRPYRALAYQPLSETDLQIMGEALYYENEKILAKSLNAYVLTLGNVHYVDRVKGRRDSYAEIKKDSSFDIFVYKNTFPLHEEYLLASELTCFSLHLLSGKKNNVQTHTFQESDKEKLSRQIYRFAEAFCFLV